MAIYFSLVIRNICLRDVNYIRYDIYIKHFDRKLFSCCFSKYIHLIIDRFFILFFFNIIHKFPKLWDYKTFK